MEKEEEGGQINRDRESIWKEWIIELTAAEIDFGAAGRKTSHDAACGSTVNNEPTIIDC